EPVFQPVLANDFIYVPGAGGTVWKVNRKTGLSQRHLNPFHSLSIDPQNTFVSGPLTADNDGRIYYNVIELSDPSIADPWFVSDVLSAWLVMITRDDQVRVASYASLLPNAPLGSSTQCSGIFADPTTLPWPPSPTAIPVKITCGSQRPGLNIAPAVAQDGT